MARLRKDTDSDVEADCLSALKTQEQPRRSKALAKKQITKSRRHTRRGTCSEHSEDDVQTATRARMVPKKKTPVSNRGKQVRLAPLNHFHEATARGPFSILTAKERLSPLQSHRKRFNAVQLVAVEPVEHSAPAAVGNTASAHLNFCNDSDSDSDTDSTTDNLPSPSTAFGIISRRRPLCAEMTKPVGLDISECLQALSILEVKEPDRDEQHPQIAPSGRQSRQSSSSDKENLDAFVRFSPPRLHKQHPNKCRPCTPPTNPPPPSKSRLPSPSKRNVRIPTPPGRPSLDSFWTADAVNSWNDQYSPQKVLKSPRKLKLFQPDNAPESPTTSPRKLNSPSKVEALARKEFNIRKHQLALDFVQELDQRITSGRVSALTSTTGGIRLIWSKTLSTTAGRANWRREKTTKPSSAADGQASSLSSSTSSSSSSSSIAVKDFASIELAEKIISDSNRLFNVLAHEFCHLANFMISGVKDQPHGAEFKRWGRLCSHAFRDRGVEVTTKHSYEIEYKYVWQCANEDCGAEFKRHSKSIDTRRHKCGKCRAVLVQVRPVPRKVKYENQDTNTECGDVGCGPYAAFVKKHFADTRKQLPIGSGQKDVMTALGRKYRENKQRQTGLVEEWLSSSTKKPGSSTSASDDVTKGIEVIMLSD